MICRLGIVFMLASMGAESLVIPSGSCGGFSRNIRRISEIRGGKSASGDESGTDESGTATDARRRQAKKIALVRMRGTASANQQCWSSQGDDHTYL